MIPELLATGWVDFPEAVAETCARMGVMPLYAAAPHLFADAGDAAAFLWKAEERVLNRKSDPWDQNPVGSCVGFGGGRAGQDCMLVEIASGEPEQWPGADVAPEVVYGGSRVEVGGGRIRGDGSVGAWAAKWVLDWGLVVRGVYGNLDLTRYNPATCRQLGANGIPADVEQLARQHPVTAVAKVTSGEEGWAALTAGKPIMVCSNRGFSMRLDADGFCSPQGVWQHCMEGVGAFTHPVRGRSVVIRNSWAAYLGTSRPAVRYVKADGTEGTFELPLGCFCTTLGVFADMLSQGDSFAFAGLKGWEKLKVDWTP